MNPWIVNRSYDLKFFIGCVILSPLCFLLLVGLVELFDLGVDESALGLYIAVLFLFDQPHVWLTLSRSHFDPAEFQRHRLRHILLPLVLILPAPLYYLIGLEEALIFVFTYFGLWHSFRQNFRLLNVYQIRGGLGRTDQWLDWVLLYLMFLSGFLPEILTAPFVSESVMEFVGEDVLITGIVPTLVEGGSRYVFIAFLCVAAFWSVCQVLSIVSSEDPGAAFRARTPRYAFLAATAAVYAFLFLVLKELFTVPLIVYLACHTIYHNVQYFGWMKRYNQVVFPDRPKRFRKWLVAGYVYAAVAVAINFWLPEVVDNASIVSSVLLMFMLYHYYLDGLIWRFKKNPELSGMIS